MAEPDRNPAEKQAIIPKIGRILQESGFDSFFF
jgi:hypothetical protein